MQEPVRIAFRSMDAPIGAEDNIRKHVADLERFYDRITACSVVVEADHRRHRQGRLYHVRINLMVPGREIVVRREPAEHHAHEELPVAIRDAFDAARRQLEDHARRVRGDVKVHVEQPVGHVARLIQDYGFLRNETGDEIYFHRNSVLGKGFDRLEVGDAVRYVVHEGEGEHGAQASSVMPI